MSIATQQNLMSGEIYARAYAELIPHSPIGKDDNSLDVGFDGYTYGPDDAGTASMLGATPLDERTGPEMGSLLNNGSVAESNQYGPVARMADSGTSFLGLIANMVGNDEGTANWNTEGEGSKIRATFVNSTASRSLRDTRVVGRTPVSSGGTGASYYPGEPYGITNWQGEEGNVVTTATRDDGTADMDLFQAETDRVLNAGAEIDNDGNYKIAGVSTGDAETLGAMGSGNNVGLARLEGMRTGG